MSLVSLSWLIFCLWLLGGALTLLSLALINRRFGVPARYALTAPLGWILSCAIMAASAYGVLTGRGLTWKGRRFYQSKGVRPPRARAHE